MDDANLKKLSVDQAGMVPEFVPDFTDYKIVVASNVEVLKVSATTSDTGASFSVKSKQEICVYLLVIQIDFLHAW